MTYSITVYYSMTLSQFLNQTQLFFSVYLKIKVQPYWDGQATEEVLEKQCQFLFFLKGKEEAAVIQTLVKEEGDVGLVLAEQCGGSEGQRGRRGMVMARFLI